MPVDQAGDKMTEIFVSGQLFGGVGMGSPEKPHRWTAGKHSFLRCDELGGQKLRQECGSTGEKKKKLRKKDCFIMETGMGSMQKTSFPGNLYEDSAIY